MRKLLVPILIFISTLAYAGGPWSPKLWEGYSEVSVAAGFSSWVADVSIQGYAELGLGRGFAARLIVPVKYVGTTMDKQNEYIPVNIGTASLWGIGNIVLGVNYQILSKKVALGVGVDIWGRTLATDPQHGLRTGYNKWSIRPRISVGQGYSKAYWLADLYADIATNNYSSGMGFIFEGGYNKNGITAAGYLQFVQSFFNGSFNSNENPAFQLTGFYADEENYLNIGGKFAWEHNSGWGLNAAVFRVFTLTDGSGILTPKLGVFKVW